MRVWVAKAQAVKGFMPSEALAWLARVASSCRLIVEIGCLWGRSTKALACSTPGVVFAVDHWQGSKFDGSRFLKGLSDLPESPAAWEECFTGFLQNLGEEIGQGKCVVLKMQSAQAATHVLSRLNGMRLDMVFIDADHSYEMVRKDILTWRPLLRPGGVISGDDYLNMWPGVVRAVDEIVPERLISAGRIWHTRVK